MENVLKYNPTNIFYMNTIECNQKCSKCSHWKYKDKADRLSIEKLTDGIKSIPTAQEFCIVGGEPLLFKSEIYQILDRISDTKIRTVIVTNGVSMDNKFIDIVSQYNIHIVVSIDTLDEKFWKFVRGANSYEKVIKNFEYAVNILPSTKLSIQSALSKETEPYLDEVSRYAQSKGVFHSIQDYINEGFEGNWTPIEKAKNGILDKSSQQCFATGRNLSIVQNGDVYTCFQQNWMKGFEKPLGNLNNQLMSEILSSEYCEAVSNQMKVCNLPCKVLKCNTKN